MNCIALLVGGIGAGQEALTEARDVCDAHTGEALNIGQCVAGPGVVQVEFSQQKTAGSL